MKLGPFEFDRIKRLGAFEKDLTINLNATSLILYLPEREKVE
jgi:hypothetical protein